MLATWVIVAASVAYLSLLFAVAYYGDRRADQHRSVISSGWVYALSLGVYATSWTYYGSVGRAAATGIGFLPIYLGPTVMVATWWMLLRKIIRICRQNRITSLADFVSARYGKSAFLGGLVTVIAVVCIVPYIALQLKAITTTFDIFRTYPELGGRVPPDPPLLADTALYVALLLAAFTILFGTRHLDATERHEGMVAAIAVECVVKLVAFLVVGVYVTFVLFDGFADLSARAAALPDVAELMILGDRHDNASWLWLIVLSMLAILLLPRQWQIAVVENVDERHIKSAMWMFPLYLLLINIFVLPVAVAGLLTLGDGVHPDAYLLALPLGEEQAAVALLVFVGGLSAATGMVIVETVALSTMVSNSLVVPVLLRRGAGLARRQNLGSIVLAIRRVTIVVLLLLGFVYLRLAGETLTLVSIGLISFAGVAQFAPALLGGLYWKGATRRGAIGGLLGGFLVWAYTLPLPSLSHAGLVSGSFVEDGPLGAGWLAPYGLFGLEGLDQVTHAMLWSSLVNVGLFVGLSLGGQRSPEERVQAVEFVDAMARGTARPAARLWRGTGSVEELQRLLERFLGAEGTRSALAAYAQRTGADTAPDAGADADLVHHVETVLAGAVGTASARLMVASAIEEEQLAVEDVIAVLDETSQVLAYSRALERKSAELQTASAELRAANEQLQELDRLKDDFVSTVSHELRTPLTSIRAFSEILVDNPDLDAAERAEYLRIIVGETERLTRLINQVLDLSKLESGGAEWRIEPVDLSAVIASSTHASAQLFRERRITLDTDATPGRTLPPVHGDRDRLVQVMLNLLSNAVKFCEPGRGRVQIRTAVDDGMVRVDVCDNGRGIPLADQGIIFEKFHQGGDLRTERPTGTGLGLPISRHIVDHLGGRMWVESTPGEGATFSFTLPVASSRETPAGTEGDT
jgi:Na+/proline symporter/nitrogen-specific signal transduction histidine kinase